MEERDKPVASVRYKWSNKHVNGVVHMLPDDHDCNCRGRKRETAELLGVSLKTLYNRLNEYRGDCDAHCAA